MDLSTSLHFQLAMSLQALALPGTLLLCIVSMLRERSIGDHDQKSLVRLYKQHAFVLELLQFFVTLMAVGLIAGNTTAAFEARSLVFSFADESVTSVIVRSALVRNFWLIVSGSCILACVNMLDSWSLPESVHDLTDPLFRLTREVVKDYIWSRTVDEDGSQDEWRYLPSMTSSFSSLPPSKAAVRLPDQPDGTKTPSESSDETINPARPLANDTSDRSHPPQAASISSLSSSIDTDNPQTPPPTAPPIPPASPPRLKPAYSPAARPHYENQTHASALRTSIKTTPAKELREKRSVTFADQPADKERGQDSREFKKTSSLIRARVTELEEKMGRRK